MRRHIKLALKDQQDGFVALIITVTVAVILSSITITFIKLMTREERQALDRQLSSQAFYAAESGTNRAVKANQPDQGTCEPGAPLDAGGLIKYTCVLVNSTPTELIFDSVTPTNPTVFNITNPVDTLILSWQNTNGGGNGRADSDYPKFFPTSTWGEGIGVLEAVIYPIVTPISRSYLEANARTFYFYPTTGSGATSVAYGDDGKVVEGNCSSGTPPNKCGQVSISGIPTAGVSGYVIRLRSIYNPLSVTINGQLGGAQTVLTGAQKIIDSTGKANDVLRRIQVRLPLRSSFVLPIFAIETADDLCKQLETEPGNAIDHCL